MWPRAGSAANPAVAFISILEAVFTERFLTRATAKTGKRFADFAVIHLVTSLLFRGTEGQETFSFLTRVYTETECLALSAVSRRVATLP
jgi:hypothetical protein